MTQAVATPDSSASPRQRILMETVHRRDEARSLLSTLREAQRVSERNLRASNLADHMKAVTGKSSLDNAIEGAGRLIESFDRVLKDLRGNLSDEDLALLDELDAEF